MASCITKSRYQNNEINEARLEPKENKHNSLKKALLLTAYIMALLELCSAECILGSSGLGGVAAGKKQTAEAAGTDLKVTKLIHSGKQVNTAILWTTLCLLSIAPLPVTVILLFFHCHYNIFLSGELRNIRHREKDAE